MECNRKRRGMVLILTINRTPSEVEDTCPLGLFVLMKHLLYLKTVNVLWFFSSDLISLPSNRPCEQQAAPLFSGYSKYKN